MEMRMERKKTFAVCSLVKNTKLRTPMMIPIYKKVRKDFLVNMNGDDDW